jgi:hypothetical protein
MIETEEGQISNEEILKILKTSGYPLEQEVASSLQKIEWSPVLNYAYTDVETDSSREIDVLCERSFWEIRHNQSLKAKQEQVQHKKWVTIEQKVRVNAELLVECKKTKSPLVFFCREKQAYDFFPSQSDNLIQWSGVRSEIVVKPINELSVHSYSIGQFLRFGILSHYSKAKEVSSQFCKIHKEGKKFKADHGEIYQSFVVPLVKAVEWQKRLHPYRGTPYQDLFLYYPIIVAEGTLLKVNPECNEIAETNHVELLRRYYSGKVTGCYRIDVVSKDYFSDFVEKIVTPSIIQIDEEVGKKENHIIKGSMRIKSIESLKPLL